MNILDNFKFLFFYQEIETTINWGKLAIIFERVKFSAKHAFSFFYDILFAVSSSLDLQHTWTQHNWLGSFACRIWRHVRPI
jgi:hypothetical protein